MTEARVELATAVREIVREMLAARERQPEIPDEELPQDDSKPLAIHVLLRVLPGSGKTHAILKEITNKMLTTMRIAFITPTIRTSAEGLARRRADLPDDDNEFWESDIT